MSFDSALTAALCHELRQEIIGSRVQKVIQPDERSLALELYAGKRVDLFLSGEQQVPRVYLASSKLRRGADKPSQLLLLARKHLIGWRVTRVHQPSFERLIEFEFGNTWRLVAELIPRKGNLLLVEENKVMAVSRKGHRVSDARNQIGSVYGYPPRPAKLDPTDISVDLMQNTVRKRPPTVLAWKLLVNEFMGISPLLAKEIIHLAAGDVNITLEDAPIPAIVDAMEDVVCWFDDQSWDPHLVLDEANTTHIIPKPYDHLARETVKCNTVSEAIERYYIANLAIEPFDAARQPLREFVTDRLNKLERKKRALTRQILSPDEIEEMRIKGELLLTYASSIEPKQQELVAVYDEVNPAVTITLDPNKTVVEQAKTYFARYKKAKRAAKNIMARSNSVAEDIIFLQQAAIDIRLARTWPDLDQISRYLQEAGFALPERKLRPSGGSPGPLKVVTEDGWVIWVGKNSQQNEVVTFKKAAAHDLWLHARGVPGSHVVIMSTGRSVPKDVQLYAASLAAGYSQAKDEKNVLVDIVERRKVRRLRSSKRKPGMVTYSGERSVRVKPKTALPHNTTK
ncbi:MAG: NFACT family protein [Chloroflexota bacterium]